MVYQLHVRPFRPLASQPPPEKQPFFLKVPRWGTAGAYRRRPRKAADGRLSEWPAALGAGPRRGVPPPPNALGGEKEKKKPQSFCAVLCKQRAAGGAALREQRERKPSEKRRSQQIAYFFRPAARSIGPVVVQQIGLLGGFRLCSASFWLLLVRLCVIASDTDDYARF